MLPKPEEVSKKQNKVLEVFKARASQFLVFLRPPQVLTIFLLKTLPKPEEVSKEPKSKGENVAKT